jgi:signal transduction histidine kinase
MVPIRGDPSSLEQVFANLIGNALNFLDPKRPGVIDVGCRNSSEGFTTYFVRDNGLGIASVHHQKIFQVFQRIHLTAKGEGMGLAIVTRVVERHRGRVWVESEEGCGCTFFVSIPSSKTDNQ